MHTGVLEADQGGAEEDLGGTGLVCVADVDLGTIGKDVVIGVVLPSCGVILTTFTIAIVTIFALLQLIGGEQTCIVILAHFADSHLSLAVHFFDLTDDLELSCRTERVTTALEQKAKMLSDVSATKIDSTRSVLNGEALVDSTSVTAAITDIKHHSRCQTTGVKTQHT